MMILDVNESLGLALVANDDLSEIYYKPAIEIDVAFGGPTIHKIQFAYLKQAHYCARSSAVGLTVQSVELQPGWQEYDAAAKLWGNFR